MAHLTFLAGMLKPWVRIPADPLFKCLIVVFDLPHVKEQPQRAISNSAHQTNQNVSNKAHGGQFHFTEGHTTKIGL
jgi:hypothetical protein